MNHIKAIKEMFNNEEYLEIFRYIEINKLEETPEILYLKALAIECYNRTSLSYLEDALFLFIRKLYINL